MSIRLGIGIDVISGISKIANMVLAYFARVTAAGGGYEGEVCLKTKLQDLDTKLLLDNASLVMIPSGYEEDIVFSQVPTSGLGDLNFTRASEGTRINAEGLIENMPYNLVTYSEQLNNADWEVFTPSIVTPNTTIAPNGTLTADTVAFGASQYLYQQFNINGWASAVFSIYAKTTNQSIVYGGATPTGTDVYTVENVGDGWYRQILTRTFTTGGTGTIQTIPYGINVTVILWGAQLVQGSTPKSYLPTTDRLNMPRLTYPIGSGCPSLLLEPQRTNSILYSEQFDNGVWSKIAVGGASAPVVTANSTIAPDGNLTADKIVFNAPTSSDISIIKQAISLTGTANGSIYVKAFASGDIGKIIGFRFNADTYGLITLTDAWQRFDVTQVALESFELHLRPAIGTSSGSVSVYVWGAQLEAGSYPTSYIPTTTATVTRLADSASKTGISSLIGQTEGTIFLDFKLNGNSYSDNTLLYYVTLAKNSPFNFFEILRYNNSLLYFIALNGVASTPTVVTAFSNLSNRYKLAISYNLSGLKFFLNGILILTNTDVVPPCDEFNFGDYDSFLNQTNNFNSVQLYKTALTDNECIALTTI